MLYFENYEELAINIADKYDEVKNSEDLNSIDIVAKYEGAKEIIRELIAIGYGIAFINIVVNGRFCPKSDRGFCPKVAGFNAGTYEVPAYVL